MKKNIEDINVDYAVVLNGNVDNIIKASWFIKNMTDCFKISRKFEYITYDKLMIDIKETMTTIKLGDNQDPKDTKNEGKNHLGE